MPMIKIPDGMSVLRNVGGLLDDIPGVPGCLVAPNGTPYIIVVSVSGGKDSTALILALREAGIPARYVFADTGWEADETYWYLDYLRERLEITIKVVGVDGGMVARIRQRAGFPARKSRFCTRELKIEPLRAHHDEVIEQTGIETICAIGIRGQESDPRSKMTEWEDEGPTFNRERWGGYVWRPLLTWTVEEVLEMHNRHQVRVNPLYQEGFDRVGCYPCIYSGKDAIRIIAKRTPDRIDMIRDLEVEMRDLRRQRNEESPGRYAWPDAATFFQTKNGRRVVMCKLDHDHAVPPGEKFGPDCKPVRALVGSTPMDIDQIVAWARTGDGGKQYDLFDQPPRGGCVKWGLCDLGDQV